MAQRTAVEQLQDKVLQKFTIVEAHLFKLQHSFEINFEHLLPWLDKHGISYLPALKTYPYIRLGCAIYFAKKEKTVAIDYELDYHAESADGAAWRTHESHAFCAWPAPYLQEFLSAEFGIVDTPH
jgi:hypothetical protein